MKKILTVILILCTTFALIGCTTEKAEPQTYTAYGRYYTNIEVEGIGIIEGVITDDGNVWEYHTDTISDRTPSDAMPVWVGFNDNGTPADITDDIVLGLVYDLNTAIYDDLETALSDKFEVHRNKNNIQIRKR
jgi:hypothetical protein